MTRIILPIALFLLAACGGRTIGAGPAPEQATIEVWRVELEDNSNAVVLQARNNGSVPVVIGELHLYSCTNLRQDCTTHQPNVRIEPGQTVQVARLDPSNHNRRPSFGYQYQWRNEQAQRSVVSVRSGDRPMTMIKVDEFVPLVGATEEDGVCLTPPDRELPPGYHAYAMQFGPRNTLPVRSVMVQLDAQGNPIIFSDSRGDLRVPPPGIVPPRPIANPGARTSISLNLLNGIAMLWNVAPDGTVQEWSAHGSGLLDARSLGPPRAVIERMVRECSADN